MAVHIFQKVTILVLDPFLGRTSKCSWLKNQLHFSLLSFPYHELYSQYILQSPLKFEKVQFGGVTLINAFLNLLFKCRACTLQRKQNKKGRFSALEIYYERSFIKL